MKRKSKFSRFMRSALAFALTASCCSGICLSNISCGEKFDPVAEIVNKDGVDAVVTYVIDDGNKPTGTFAREMLDKYQYLTVSFAVWTKDFATLKELPDGSQYVMAGNKYTYTQTDAQVQNVNFWNDILSGGRCELISHTHTHNFWGTNDDGGTFQYVKNNESNVLTATMPKGSVSKEVYGSNQILKELFPSSDFPTQSYLGLITPGIGVRTADFTTNDGKVIPTYNTYFLKLMQQAIQRGEYIAARGTFQTTNTKDSSSRVITPSKLEKLTDRMNVPAYMIVTENRNSSGSATEGGIENWTAYIDHAIEQKGWACYCIHNIHENVTDHAGHKIDERDAEELFAYTADKSVWVATFSDAVRYYTEWSTATVESSYKGGTITVEVTDREDDDTCNIPLTVKVKVPEKWETAAMGGESLKIYVDTDGSHYVYASIVPDSGAVAITAG